MPGISDIGFLILRIVTGLVFVAHGSQKLFGWFGGHGLSGHAGFMRSLGIRPALLFALINALGEFLGGLGLAAGLLTPVAVVGPLGSMGVAIFSVHWRKGFWNHSGGFEYPLVLATIAFVVGLAGPGRFSLDAVLRLRLPEPWTYIAALAATAVTVAYASSRSAPASAAGGGAV